MHACIGVLIKKVLETKNTANLEELSNPAEWYSMVHTHMESFAINPISTFSLTICIHFV